jgi:hypothetical protein
MKKPTIKGSWHHEELGEAETHLRRVGNREEGPSRVPKVLR